MPATKLDIAVVDKTVGPSYREHQAIFWMDLHNKIVPSNSGKGTGDPDGDGKYNYDTDYYGFYPVDNSSTNILDIDLDPTKVDILYLADTYGANETYGPPVSEWKNYTAGISAAEASSIWAFTQRGGSIYAEWNVLGDPTYNDTRAEAIMSDVLHLNYLGYGSFFVDLSNVNRIMKLVYRASSGLEWNFTGPGIVILLDSPSIGNVTMVVLEKEDLQDVKVPVRLELTSVKSPITEGIARELEYPVGYWFEVVKPYSDAQQLARYRLETTPSGDAKLARYGLNSTFPALLQYDGSYRAVYCAADATDYAGAGEGKYPPKWQAHISGIEVFWRYNSVSLLSPMEQYFWRFYEPMMANSYAWLAERY